MAKFNPDFWEIPLPPDFFDQLTTEDHLWYQSPSDEYSKARQVKRQKALKQIRQIITKELTACQNDCVRLYFYEGKT